jgi:hypothetical protein
MGGKSAPKAPDYAAAAQEQAQGSREVTEQQTWANRPDQFTPWGKQTWENQQVWDPSTQQYLNRWAQNTELTPESQRALDAQLGLTGDRSELGRDLMGRAEKEFGTEMDWSKFQPGGGRINAPGSVEGGPIQKGISTEGLTNLDPSGRYNQQANDAIYNQWASRALPEQQRQSEQMRTKLYNMGLKEGDEAYDAEMEKLGQQQGDAMQQAQYQATIGSGAEAQRFLGMDAATRAQMFGERGTQGQFGNAAQAQEFGQGMAGQSQDFQQELAAGGYNTQQRQQQIAEEMQKRGFSLNEINALISGQQVGMPSMPGFNTAAASQGPQSLTAAQLTGQSELDRFNAQQAGTQGMMSGLGSLAGGFMGFSDRRLKRNIRLLGKVSGVNLYSWTYLWGEPSVGVMADEVPWAIAGEVVGFKVVDYRRVW